MEEEFNSDESYCSGEESPLGTQLVDYANAEVLQQHRANGRGAFRIPRPTSQSRGPGGAHQRGPRGRISNVPLRIG